MEQVAHQTIVMQFILELAKSLKVDPRACFRQFFTKIKVGALSSRDRMAAGPRGTSLPSTGWWGLGGQGEHLNTCPLGLRPCAQNLIG